MNYTLIRAYHQFDFKDDVQMLYAHWCDTLRTMDRPWGLRDMELKPMKDPKMAPSTGVSYRMLAPFDTFGVSYFNRHRKRDEGETPSCDDMMTVGFNAEHKSISLCYVFDEVLPAYIHALNAYYLGVENMELALRHRDAIFDLPHHEQKRVRTILFGSYPDRVAGQGAPPRGGLG